jgi:hypothetical protein
MRVLKDVVPIRIRKKKPSAHTNRSLDRAFVAACGDPKPIPEDDTLALLVASLLKTKTPEPCSMYHTSPSHIVSEYLHSLASALTESEDVDVLHILEKANDCFERCKVHSSDARFIMKLTRAFVAVYPFDIESLV